MRDYNSNLNVRIKAGLQFCHQVLNKGKYLKQEYQLLSDLAELYFLKGDIREYPQIVAIYHYLHKLVDKAYQGTDNKGKHEELDRSISLVEEEYIEKVTRKRVDKRYDGGSFRKIRDYKRRLEEYRGIEETESYDRSIRSKLKDIEDLGIIEGHEELDEEGLIERSKAVESIYMDIREFFIGKRVEGTGELTAKKKGIINELIKDCIEELGGLPQIIRDQKTRTCEYAIFGMGSMALGTMTPWSDIEFGILIEEGLSEAEEKLVKKYFRNLTTLLHIKVINFGETPLRMMGIEELNNFKSGNSKDDWFYDELINPGFSFDGPHWHACKTPLGRKGYTKYKDFELVCTPREMSQLHDETSYQYDIELGQALMHFTLINGMVGLLEYYKDLIGTKHDNEKRLSLRQERAFKILKEDCTKYEPLMTGDEKEGALYNVKKDIYRLPDRLIISLGDCFDIRGTNNWHLIENLYHMKIVSHKAAQNLILALSISAEMRIRTYSVNNAQKENLSVLAVIEQEHENKETVHKNNLEVFFLQKLGILKRYYYTVLPLQALIKKSLNYIQLRQNIQYTTIYSNSDFIKATIYQRLMDYKEAKKCFKNSYKEGQVENTGITEENLGNVCFRLAEYDEAILHHKQALEKRGKLFDISPQDYVRSLNDIGSVYYRVDQYNEALSYYKRALEIGEKEIGTSHPEYSRSLRNIGSINSRKKGTFDEALNYYSQALKISEKTIGKSHAGYAILLYNIGVIYDNKGFYNKAIKFHSQALKIREHIFGSNHPLYAQLLQSIGGIYYSKGIYIRAVAYYKQALEVKKQVLGEVHPDIGMLLNNIANICHHKGNYDEAISYYKHALEISEKILGKTHTDYALLLTNIGKAYHKKGSYDEALKYYKQALEINKRILGERHPDYAISLHSLGLVYYSKGSYDEALNYYKQALEIRENILGKAHPDYEISLNDIGNVYNKKGSYDEALSYHLQALEISEKTCGRRHPNYARSLNNLGSTYYRKGNYNEALSYYKQVLEIREKTIGKAHHDYARSLHNIGLIFDKQGNYDEALKYYKEALEISGRVLGETHSDYATILNIIGEVHHKKGNSEESLTLCIQVLEIRRKVLGKNHPEYKSTLEKVIKLSSNYVSRFPSYRNNGRIIEFLEEFCQLFPSNLVKRHNLACCYHTQAYLAKLDNNNDKYSHYLYKARESFKIAFMVKPDKPLTSNFYVENAMFLIKYHNTENLEEYEQIKELLQKAIQLGDDKTGLSYGKLDHETVVESLQVLLEKQEKITINRPHLLAYHLLVKIHNIHRDMKTARETFEAFKAIVLSLQKTENTELPQYLYEYSKKELSAVVIQRTWRNYIQNKEVTTDHRQTMH